MSGNGGNSDESNTHIGNNKRRGLMPKGLAATVATLVSDLATDVANLAAHIAATVAHGATGAVVGTTNAQTLSNKTLTTPTIANLTNMQHDHQGGAGGGTLTAPVIVRSPTVRYRTLSRAPRRAERSGQRTASSIVPLRSFTMSRASASPSP